MTKKYDKSEIIELVRQGVSYGEIERQTGCTPGTTGYHARRAGLSKVPPFTYVRHYDWAEIQAYYDQGFTLRECVKRFGACLTSFWKAEQRGEFKARERELLPLVSHKSRKSVRSRLVAAGRGEKCEKCGASEWMGSALSLHLHHKNGNGKDHREENIEFLCPNCHSQTGSYAGRNKAQVVT